MAGDPGRVVVTSGATPDAVSIHHRDFPQVRADGESPRVAAENLAADLARERDAVADALHRGPLERALADVEAFLGAAPDAAPPPGE